MSSLELALLGGWIIGGAFLIFARRPGLLILGVLFALPAVAERVATAFMAGIR